MIVARSPALHPIALPGGRGLSILTVAGFLVLVAGTSGNNLFLLLAALLSATFVVAHREARSLLAGLSVEAYAPDEGLFANRKALLALGLVSPRGPMRLHLAYGDGARIACEATPDGSLARVPVLPPRRGPWRLEALRIWSASPYGICRVRHLVDLCRPLLVYPEPAADPEIAQRIAALRPGPTPLAKAGAGSDLLSLREHRPEDGIRRIHWRASAKAGTLVAKVYEEEEALDLLLVLDRTIPEDTAEWRARFEEALSRLCAAILEAHARDLRFTLQASGCPVLSGRGVRHRNGTLALLALVCPVVSSSPDRALPSAIRFSARDAA